MTQKQKIAAHEALVQAYNIIKNPKKWTQGSYAVNKHGEDTSPRSAEACRWCADGALLAVVTDRQWGDYNTARDILDTEAGNLGYGGVISTNDLPSVPLARRSILKAFRAAIERTAPDQA